MKVEMKISGVAGVLNTLRRLPPEIVSKRGGPVKLALAKGARFLRDKEKVALRSAIAVGGSDDSTGLLEESVIASRGKPPTSGKGERYIVRVKRKVYPDREGKPVTTIMTAHYLEYGTSKQPATPFIRPTFQANAAQAITIITTDLRERVDKIVAKLAAQNRRR